MNLLKMLQEGMQVVEVKATTTVVATLDGEPRVGHLRGVGAGRLTNSLSLSSTPYALTTSEPNVGF